MNRPAALDHESVAHLLNLVASGVLTYAAVTRGGLAVSHGIAYLVRRAG